MSSMSEHVLVPHPAPPPPLLLSQSLEEPGEKLEQKSVAAAGGPSPCSLKGTIMATAVWVFCFFFVLSF